MKKNNCFSRIETRKSVDFRYAFYFHLHASNCYRIILFLLVIRIIKSLHSVWLSTKTNLTFLLFTHFYIVWWTTLFVTQSKPRWYSIWMCEKVIKGCHLRATPYSLTWRHWWLLYSENDKLLRVTCDVHSFRMRRNQRCRKRSQVWPDERNEGSYETRPWVFPLLVSKNLLLHYTQQTGHGQFYFFHVALVVEYINSGLCSVTASHLSAYQRTQQTLCRAVTFSW